MRFAFRFDSNLIWFCCWLFCAFTENCEKRAKTRGVRRRRRSRTNRASENPLGPQDPKVSSLAAPKWACKSALSLAFNSPCLPFLVERLPFNLSVYLFSLLTRRESKRKWVCWLRESTLSKAPTHTGMVVCGQSLNVNGRSSR